MPIKNNLFIYNHLTITILLTLVIQRYEIEYLLVMIALRIRFVCTYFLDVRKWELLLYHWSELSCTESFIDMISKIRFFESLSRGLY